jgi:hypothetical protein
MSSTFAQITSQSSLKKLPPCSLVFIDSGVEDYESLAAGVLPGQQVVIPKTASKKLPLKLKNTPLPTGRSTQYTSFLTAVQAACNSAIPL